MIPKLQILLLIIIVGGSVSLAALALVFYSPPCLLGTATPTIHFAIIESSLGYNDSKVNFPNPWPIMRVHCGQMVSIHIQNTDSSEPHGFKIDKYVGAIVLRSGLSSDVSFTATQAGTFTVYCTILCVVHQYMLNGKLIVTS